MMSGRIVMKPAPKTVENYAELERILTEATKIHQGFRDRINFSVQNRAHAIYLLQGSVLTNALAALNSARQGYLNQVLATTRLLFESIELMDFFASIADDDRHLQAWYRDEVVTPPKPSESRTYADHIKALRGVFPSADERQLRRIQELQRKRWEFLSKSAHPTLRAVRYNMTPEGAFSYNCWMLREAAMENYTVELFLVSPVISALGMYLDIIRPNPAEFEEIEALLDRLSTKD